MGLQNFRYFTTQDLFYVLNIPITIEIGHARYPAIESIDCRIIGGEMDEDKPIVASLLIETTTGATRTIPVRTIKAISERD